PHTVDFVRLEDPTLRYELAAESWPAGTVETAAALDAIGLILEVRAKDAVVALKDAGNATRREVVLAALRYRKQANYQREPSREPLSKEKGNRSPEPQSQQIREPPPEPMEPSSRRTGNSGSPLKGNQFPSPDLEECFSPGCKNKGVRRDYRGLAWCPDHGPIL